MRVLRVALSPLLAAWLMLLAGMAPAHCLLRANVMPERCGAAAFDADDGSGDAEHQPDMPCLVSGSLPGILPPGPPLLAGPICHAALRPGIVAAPRVQPAPSLALPQARAPPVHA